MPSGRSRYKSEIRTASSFAPDLGRLGKQGAMKSPVTKYRASCDGCYLAKVKCTKERPCCPRCKHLGLECQYSPSQRAGKSRGAPSQALENSNAPERFSSNHNNSTSISPTTIDGNPQQCCGARSDFHSISDISANSLGDTAFMLPHLDDTNFLTPWRDYLPNLESEQPLFGSPNGFADFPNATTTTTTTSPISPPASHLSQDPDLMQLTTCPTTSECSCISSLAQTLQTMESQSTHPNDHPPALEIILGSSKDVITRGEALLHCACSDYSTPIMLFTALIAKYLTFYGSATSRFDSSPEQYHPSDFISPSSSSSSSSTTPSHVPTHSSSSSCAGHSRVKIGTYTLDAEGEERLRVKIMMMELQKLGTMLAKLRAKFASLPVG
ncbi:MAG: hypothetical protein Q9196_007232, partial [Gyalolechia fulgens]